MGKNYEKELRKVMCIVFYFDGVIITSLFSKILWYQILPKRLAEKLGVTEDKALDLLDEIDFGDVRYTDEYKVMKKPE